MVYLFALLIFVALSAACWLVSFAGYRGTVTGSDPDYPATAAAANGVTALTSFVPLPLGYPAGPVVWAVAALGGLDLIAGRAALVFLSLAASSVAAQLVVPGVTGLFGVRAGGRPVPAETPHRRMTWRRPS